MCFDDLNEEAFVLVFAGADTSANSIMIGAIHVIENRHVYQTLKEELMEAWPVLEDKPSYEALERLPYLVRFYSSKFSYVEGSRNRRIQTDCCC